MAVLVGVGIGRAALQPVDDRAGVGRPLRAGRECPSGATWTSGPWQQRRRQPTPQTRTLSEAGRLGTGPRGRPAPPGHRTKAAGGGAAADADGRLGGPLLRGDLVQFMQVHAQTILSRLRGRRPGVCWPCHRPSRTTAGAMPQAPRQRAVSSDSLPSAVVSPAWTSPCPSTAARSAVGPLDVAGGPGADDAGVLPLRLEREEVVEGGDAVDLARRQLQAVGDEESRSSSR